MGAIGFRGIMRWCCGQGKYCASGGEENEKPSVLFAKLQLWLLLIWLYGFGSTTTGSEKFPIWSRVNTRTRG